jgi:ABC-type uncharacterized transport system ATPase subunit
MQEVQAVCTDYIIINKGKLVASGAIGKRQAGGSVFLFEVAGPVHLPEIEALSEVLSIKALAHTGHYHLTLRQEREGRAQLIRYCADHGLALSRLAPAGSDLEAEFRRVTQEA